MGEAVFPDHLGECNTANVSVKELYNKGPSVRASYSKPLYNFILSCSNKKIKMWILLCTADPQAQDTFKHTS